ncbi:MAG: hypothetical protein M3137_07215 [Actinomycetota bacterium]|nr:hypothetical protein [Actinomycetota bacterium]
MIPRGLPAAAVTAGMDAVLGVGAVDPTVVAIEARRPAPMSVAPVVAIGDGHSRFDRQHRPPASYDDLLEAR